MKNFRILAAMFLVCVLPACASSNAAKTAKGSGQSVVYNAAYDKTWNASINAVEATGGEIVEQDKVKGDIVATYGVSAFSWGERVAVFLKSLAKNKTEVEVVSKRAVGMNVTAANWQDDIHQKIADNLSK